uniref:Uncharacterized protein n=1 Tax=Anopheles coluzzii TaxID=1518534 RepID=A0A8W7PEF2_ANOCL
MTFSSLAVTRTRTHARTTTTATTTTGRATTANELRLLAMTHDHDDDDDDDERPQKTTSAAPAVCIARAMVRLRLLPRETQTAPQQATASRTREPACSCRSFDLRFLPSGAFVRRVPCIGMYGGGTGLEDPGSENSSDDTCRPPLAGCIEPLGGVRCDWGSSMGGWSSCETGST